MGKKTRSYTAEFKNEAVELALDTVSIGGAAKDLGIPVSTLHTWVTQSNLSPSELKSSNATNEQQILNVKLLVDKNREKAPKAHQSPRAGDLSHFFDPLSSRDFDLENLGRVD